MNMFRSNVETEKIVSFLNESKNTPSFGIQDLNMDGNVI